MKSFPTVAVAVAVFLTLCLCGCDYTRRGGAYRLAHQTQATQNSAVAVETKDAEALRRVLGQWLSSNGFQEFKGKRTVWNKRGARVYVSQESETELVIEFFAMGYTSDLRLSEETERELLTYLEKQPGLKITPTTPPRPTSN